MKQFLFAYGTLRKDFAPPEIAEIAEKLRFVGEGFVCGSIQEIGEYTSVNPGSKGKVFGHIFELPDDDEILQKLDEYEGYLPENPSESFYLRKESPVFINDKEIICWIYQYNRG